MKLQTRQSSCHLPITCFLLCQVSGLPPPDLIWLLNGRPVLPDTTHKMLVRETGVHSLLIDPLTQNDAGIYTCIATNKTGQNSFSLELSVVGKSLVHKENQWIYSCSVSHTE